MADRPRWRVVLARVRRIWVACGAASLALMPVYAWWTYTPRLPEELRVSPDLEMSRGGGTLEIRPRGTLRPVGLVWIAGCLVPVDAYLPLALDVAQAGHAVTIVPLPWRCAPLPAQRAAVIARVERLVQASGPGRWIVGGHSKGAVLATELAIAPPRTVVGLVLAGTTHPRDVDLSTSRFAITKIVATHDGIAPLAVSEARRGLLPADVTWVTIAGGNHSQFGWYGWQLGDGRATLDHAAQQRQLSAAVLAALTRAEGRRDDAGAPREAGADVVR